MAHAFFVAPEKNFPALPRSGPVNFLLCPNIFVGTAAGAARQWPVHYYTFPIFSHAAARWAGDLFFAPTFFVAAAMGARGSHPIFSERCRAVNGWDTAGLCPVDFFYGQIFLVTHGRAVGPLIFFWRPTYIFPWPAQCSGPPLCPLSICTHPIHQSLVW